MYVYASEHINIYDFLIPQSSSDFYFLFLQFHGVMVFSHRHRNIMKVYNVDAACNCNVALANIWLSGPCGDLGQDTFSWEN